MECKYHTILNSLYEVIWDRIESHYNWSMFCYWLGDESDLATRYKETFEQVVETPLTPEQIKLLEKKGCNLEVMIGKWCGKWKENHPHLENETMPESCLKLKIFEHIIYQLNKPDIIAIIGPSC